MLGFSTLIRHLRKLAGHKSPDPVMGDLSTKDAWGRPYDRNPVLRNGNFRASCTISEAVLLVLYRHGPERMTVREIADFIRDNRETYGFAVISPAQVNAAISGMSVRSRKNKWVDDRPDGKGDVKEGLKTAWHLRRWTLTPAGERKTRGMAAAKSRKLEVAASRRDAILAQEAERVHA